MSSDAAGGRAAGRGGVAAADRGGAGRDHRGGRRRAVRSRPGDPLAVTASVGLFVLAATGVALVLGVAVRSEVQAPAVAVPAGLVLGMLGGALRPRELVGETMVRGGELTPHGWVIEAVAAMIGVGAGELVAASWRCWSASRWFCWPRRPPCWQAGHCSPLGDRLARVARCLRGFASRNREVGAGAAKLPRSRSRWSMTPFPGSRPRVKAVVGSGDGPGEPPRRAHPRGVQEEDRYG